MHGGNGEAGKMRDDMFPLASDTIPADRRSGAPRREARDMGCGGCSHQGQSEEVMGGWALFVTPMAAVQNRGSMRFATRLRRPEAMSCNRGLRGDVGMAHLHCRQT